MNTRKKLGVIICIMSIIALITGNWIKDRPVGQIIDADLKTLPMKIGGWTGTDVKLNDNVKDVLNADVIISRKYNNVTSGDSISLLIVYRKFGRRDFAHRPEICYPASGWEIVSKGNTTINYNKKNIDAIEVVAQKQFRRDMIVYWFASGEKSESSYLKQQAMMSLDRLSRSKYGWAFIRLVSSANDSNEDALNKIRIFTTDVSEPLQEALTGKHDMTAKMRYKQL